MEPNKELLENSDIYHNEQTKMKLMPLPKNMVKQPILLPKNPVKHPILSPKNPVKQPILSPKNPVKQPIIEKTEEIKDESVVNKLVTTEPPAPAKKE
jgi:hypothetical protein